MPASENPDRRPENHPTTHDTLLPLERRVTVGGPPETDMNVIVDRYVSSLPPGDIILDLRGQVVATGRKWS